MIIRVIREGELINLTEIDSERDNPIVEFNEIFGRLRIGITCGIYVAFFINKEDEIIISENKRHKKFLGKDIINSDKEQKLLMCIIYGWHKERDNDY